MGQVYRATDTRLKRQVAIKVLAASVAADRDRLARFQREAEVLASLNHPHVAGIYGFEEGDGVSALVMQRVLYRPRCEVRVNANSPSDATSGRCRLASRRILS